MSQLNALQHDDNQLQVETYEFEPIKGYPRLHWKGKRPFRSTHYYPAQLRESYGEPVDGWMNEIYWGDNLQVMSHLLKKYRGKIKLIYIDPPFDSKANYKKKIELNGQKFENDYSCFEEKQYKDIWENDTYFQYLYERFITLRELISDDGSIFVHTNDVRNHYIKIILDEVMGSENYRNEIVLRNINKNLQGQFEFLSSMNRYGDYILWYSKKSDSRFRIPTKEFFRKGYWHGFKQPADRSNLRYPLLDVEIYEGQWMWEKERAYKAVENYNLFENKYQNEISFEEYASQNPDLDFIRLSNTGIPEYYLAPKNETICDTLWDDFLAYSYSNVKYPTEKNEKLLHRIISFASEIGEIVFDCFMGSGTTQAVAMKLGRRFIGADINAGAVHTTVKRLINVTQDFKTKTDGKFYTGFSVFNVNHYDIFRNELEARDLLIKALEIEPLNSGSYFDGTKDEFKVKIMPINRIATRKDVSDLVNNLDYKTYEKIKLENPMKAADNIMLVCMGHEPDLAAHFKKETEKYRINLKVYDIFRDGSHLTFKYDSEAKIEIKNNILEIKQFYPTMLLEKLRKQNESVTEYLELVESVMIDPYYDGAVFTPTIKDIPAKHEIVKGKYELPADHGRVAIKITDLLSEIFFKEVTND